MKTRRILSGLAVAALAATSSLTSATPASAATWNESMYTDDGDSGGVVRFRHDGDVVRLCDIQADGWKVHLSVYSVWEDRNQYRLNVGGNGNCIEARASFGGPYNLRENHVYMFTIWLEKDGVAKFYDEAFWRA
jgi:hypothetical protein